MVPQAAPSSVHELWRAWRQALAILLGGAAVYVLFDALLFRTGFYDRILDPHSSTGVVEFTLSAEDAHDYFAKPVLILGNSVMAEGFSARLANWLQLAKGYEFSNAAVAGTLERTWHYMLRDLDPDCKRYSVIVVPVDSYDDRGGAEDPADRIDEAHYLAARLRLSDAAEFAGSFRSFDKRIEVLRGTLLKSLVYRQDLRKFLENPAKRLAEVKSYRRDEDWLAYNYRGNDHSLKGLAVDANGGVISFPGGLSPAERQKVIEFFAHAPARHSSVLSEYRRRWLGRIVERYQGTATRILFVRPPTNPVSRPQTSADLSRGAVRDLASRPGVLLMDENAFSELERPEFFLDLIHLNAAGRARFTTEFAGLFAEIVEAHSERTAEAR
jgi:hypothetical protein